MKIREEQCKNEFCCSGIIHGEDFFLNGNNCEVQVDIITKKIKNPVVIWGTVKDCCNEPIVNAIVKLMKYEHECGNDMQEVCHSTTDCCGYYQFDLCQGSQGKYRVIVCNTICDRNQEKPCMQQKNMCHCQNSCCNENGCVLKNKVYYY